jgi:hypothetical protein
MPRTILMLRCLVIAGLLLPAFAQARAEGGAPEGEPDKETCDAAVGRARTLAETLPNGNLSRYFAEREMQQALAEAGNREYDDCVEWAEKAAREITDPHHQLKPGESLTVLHGGAIVSDPQQTPQVKSSE